MPLFHWLFLAFLIGVLILIAMARRADQPDAEPEAAKRVACSICGEEHDPEQTLEREFTSGYRHFLCGGCIARLYGDASRRELIPDEHRHS